MERAAGVDEPARLAVVPADVDDGFRRDMYHPLDRRLPAVVCYFLTVICWIVMGRNWSVAVVEDDQQLVTAGPFRFARHPIYALSILLIICTAIVLPTLPMAIVALLHIVLLNIKARGEEQHLLNKYGDHYRAYMQTTGRFMPNLPRHSTQ